MEKGAARAAGKLKEFTPHFRNPRNFVRVYPPCRRCSSRAEAKAERRVNYSQILQIIFPGFHFNVSNIGQLHRTATYLNFTASRRDAI